MVSTNTLFYACFTTYVVLFAGSMYNYQQSPPAMGSNPQGKPLAILLHHVNRQYIIEGMAAAFMVLMASIGVILVTSFGKPVQRTIRKWKPPEFQQYAVLGFGAVLFVVGYNILTVFLRIKVPLYLSTSL